MKRYAAAAIWVVVLAAILAGQSLLWSPAILANQSDDTYIQFVIDSSLSMRKKIAPGQNRLDVAKVVLEEVLLSLPARDDLKISLRVYGADLVPDQPCRDSVLVHGFDSPDENRSKIITTVKSLRPSGMTPIGYSLQEAAKDFPQGTRNVIILITDGAESCRSNPCEISRELQAQGIILEPYVVGFDMAPEEEALVACIGKYYSARDLDSLKKALNSIMAEAISPTMLAVTATAAGRNVTGSARIEVLDAKGQAVYSRPAGGTMSEMAVALSPGTYTVRGELDLGPSTLESSSPSFDVKEGQTSRVALDFGDLRGTVTVKARAGRRDVSDSVQLVVERAGREETVNWHSLPPTTSLAADTYTFDVTLKDNPQLTRTITAWIPPNEQTTLEVDLGELPAELTVQVRFMNEDVTQQSTMAVFRQGQLTSSFTQGNQVFTMKGDPGLVDLTVKYLADIPVEKAITGVELRPGEETALVVDFSDVLGVLRIQVWAGQDDVTTDAVVTATGKHSCNLAVVGKYRQAFLPAGLYYAEASHSTALDSAGIEVKVGAGQVTDDVIKLSLPGSIVLRPYLGRALGQPKDFEAHVWQEGKYIVQLAAGKDSLSRPVAPGTYTVVGSYLGDDSQTREAPNVTVASGETVEVKMVFDGVGTLRLDITAGGVPYQPDFVEVFDKEQKIVAWPDLNPNGSYTAELAEGIYDVLVVPSTESFPETWLENISVKAGQENVYSLEMGALGTLQVSIFLEDRPFSPPWVEVYDQNRERIASLEWSKDGVYINQVPTGVYDVVAVTGEGEMGDVVLEDVQVKANQLNAYDLVIGGVGELVLKFVAGSRLINPDYVELHRDGEMVGDLEGITDGVCAGKVAAGTYDIFIFPGEFAEMWLHDIRVVAGRTTEHTVEFAENTKLQLKILVGGEPCDDAYLVLLIGEREVAWPEWVDSGLYEVELPAGTYTLVVEYYSEEMDDYPREEITGFVVKPGQANRETINLD